MNITLPTPLSIKRMTAVPGSRVDSNEAGGAPNRDVCDLHSTALPSPVVGYREQMRQKAIVAWQAAPRMLARPSDMAEPVVQTLRQAMSSFPKREIVMDYTDGEGKRLESATVRPLSVYRKAGYEHVYFDAFSESHGEVRTFRVDRVQTAS